MAKLSLTLGQEDTDNRAHFHIEGSDEWVKAVVPHISYVIGSMAAVYGVDADQMGQVGVELLSASAAIAEDRDYEGQFVKVTRL
ncbi:MAG: hypothetical protein AB1631_34525 [Acidobacteriota bacterium]